MSDQKISLNKLKGKIEQLNKLRRGWTEKTETSCPLAGKHVIYISDNSLPTFPCATQLWAMLLFTSHGKNVLHYDLL